MATVIAVINSITVVFAGGFTLFIIFCIACYVWRAKVRPYKDTNDDHGLDCHTAYATNLWTHLHKQNH